MTGRTYISNAAGQKLFTVQWSGTQLTLTRTEVPAVGRFDFTYATAPSAVYRQYSNRRSLVNTVSKWRIGASVYTVNNVKIDHYPCDWTYANSFFLSNYNADSSMISARFDQCSPINDVMLNRTQSGTAQPIIAFARIKSAAGQIDSISLYNIASRWNLAYDATHVGKGSEDLTASYLANPVANNTVHSWKEAAAKLQPGQYSIVRNTDGTWDVAVNLGSQHGGNAILTDPTIAAQTWDDATNNIIRKATAAKVAAQVTSWSAYIRYKDPNAVNKATATYTIGYGSTLDNDTFDIFNSLGKQLGVGQSGIQYNGNGADSGSVAPQIGDPKKTVKTRANGFTRAGYRFDGWNTKDDGTGTKLDENVDIAYGAEGTIITLYAQWTPAPAALPQTGGDDDGAGRVAGCILVLAVVTAGMLASRRRRA